MTLAVDYSFSRPTSAQALADAGVTVAARYLWSAGKGLTLPEVNELHAAGIGILLNYEASSGLALGGASAGVQAANAAAFYATALGAPTDGTKAIYVSIDFDCTLTQWNQSVKAFVIACHQQLAARGFIGRFYGSYNVVEWCAQIQIDYDWQTYAWSGGKLSGHAAFYQYKNGQTLAGAQIDYDRVIDAANLAAWWPAGKNPHGTGTEVVTDDDIAKIVDRVWNSAVNFPELATITPAQMLVQLRIKALDWLVIQDAAGRYAPESAASFIADTRVLVGDMQTVIVGMQAAFAGLPSAVAAALPAGPITAADVETALTNVLAQDAVLAPILAATTQTMKDELAGWTATTVTTMGPKP